MTIFSARRVSVAALWTLAVAMLTAQLSAQEWTRFRGPNGSGESEATTVPTSWTEADYNWKAELPGVGHSSPVLWGDKLFVTSGDTSTGDVVVFGYNANTGKQLWEVRLGSKTHHLHARNSYASSTPAVDANHVYVAWASPDDYRLAAFTHEGKPVWQVQLGTFASSHGFAASPIVFEDLVVIGNEQKGESFLHAFKAKTGETHWQVARKILRTSYCTPCVHTPEGGSPELIFTSHGHGISAIDPKTGATNWEIEVFDKRTVSSPIVINGLVFGACGSGGGGNFVAAVRPGTKDREPELAYKMAKSAPYVPTTVAYGDLAFLWSDKGVVTCIDVATGEEYWQKRVPGNYSGSPVRVGKHVYCISEDGEVVVLAASKDFEEVARIQLDDPSRSTPAVANGQMYLRTYKYLISVGGKK